MKVIRAFLMSFSMFCSIPCPIRFWDEELRPLMTAVLPLVLLVIWAVRLFILGKTKLEEDLLPKAKESVAEAVRVRQRRAWEKRHLKKKE